MSIPGYARHAFELRSLLRTARDIAHTAGAHLIEPVHIFVAASRRADTIAGGLIQLLLKEPPIPGQVAGGKRPSPPMHGVEPQDCSNATVALLVAAEKEAAAGGQSYVGGEHLVLAMLADGQSELVRALESRGGDPKDAARTVAKLLALGDRNGQAC